MKVLCAWFLMVTSVLADPIRGESEWTRGNSYADFTRILLAGRVKSLISLSPSDTNRLTVGAALMAGGGVTVDQQDLTVTIVPKTAFRGQTNSTDVYTGSAMAHEVLERALVAGDSVFVHVRDPLSVRTNKQVLAIGELKKECVVEFGDSQTCTFRHLVLKLGGIPQYASPHAVRLIRVDRDGSVSIRKINAKELLEQGNPESDIVLQDGDVVLFPRRQIYML